jgi:hypothetical protein
MSSLIVITAEREVLVATDTLATEPDGKPVKFTTKAFVVPHLKLIMAGTGMMGFLGRWFVYMNDRMVVRGIENLDYHAPSILRTLWQAHKQEFSIPDDLTTSIYHFGFSEVENKIHSYRYKSANGFKSERLEQSCMLVKPQCSIPMDNEPLDIRKMMDEQRAIQASIPKSERVYIGGEIQVHHLSEAGFDVYTIHTFEDFARDQTEIYDNFAASKKAPN